MVKNRLDEATFVIKKMAKYNKTDEKLKEDEIYNDILKISSDTNEMVKLNESSFIFFSSPTKMEPKKKSIIEENNTNTSKSKNDKMVSSGKASLRNYFLESYRNLLTTITISFVWMACTIIYFGMTIGKMT